MQNLAGLSAHSNPAEQEDPRLDFMRADCNLYEMLKANETPVANTEDSDFDRFFLNEKDEPENQGRHLGEENPNALEIFYFTTAEKNLILNFWLKELLVRHLKELKECDGPIALGSLDHSSQIYFLDTCQEFSFISLYEEVQRELEEIGLREEKWAQAVFRNIFIAQAFSGTEMHVAVKTLGDFLKKNGRVKMVVIDCVNSFHIEWNGGKNEKKPQGQGPKKPHRNSYDNIFEGKLFSLSYDLLRQVCHENKVFLLTTKRESFSIKRAFELIKREGHFEIDRHLDESFKSQEILPKTQRIFVCDDQLSGLEDLLSTEHKLRKKSQEDSAQVAIKKLDMGGLEKYEFILLRVLARKFFVLKRGQIPTFEKKQVSSQSSLV